MFEFLTKLVSRRSTTQAKAQIVSQTLHQTQISESRQKTKEQERQQFLQKISASINNEASLLDLLIACDFADGRYQAAQHIHTQEYLLQALQATRKIDNRVAKLMQARLDQIRQQQETQQQAQVCVQQADCLLAQPLVLANQLIELDRLVEKLQTFPPELQISFDDKRRALQARLNAQVDLQRQLLQLVQDIDQAQDLSAIDGDAAITSWSSVLQSCLSSSIASALPKALLQDAQNKLVAFEATWRKWQQRSTSSQEIHTSNSHSAAQLESANSIEATSQVQTELVSKSVKSEKSVKVASNKPTLNLTLAQIEDLLSRFEAALTQGSAQAARQIEKELREVDTKRHYHQLHLSDRVKERLNAARKELAHMMSWAKWSGAVSRDELITTAEKLTSLSLSPQEIVDTVSALREQWKQMESTSGGAPKELWLRFDTACKLVYAPAAAHFQLQADLRKDNLIKAETLLSQFAEEADQILANLNDWKLVRSKILDMQQTWKKIGHVDRKERVRLDKDFDALLNSLKAPLAQRQQEEIYAREKMIAEVQALDAHQKSTQDQLRSLQQRWQVQATAVPLQRKDEQQLWERFRAACDGVFEKKRQLAESADQQRESNLKSKQAICQELANADCTTRSALRQIMDKANLAWREVGHVPRAQEQSIEKEFQGQLQRLQEQIAQLQKQESQQQRQKMQAGLSICQKLETDLEADTLSTDLLDKLSAEWRALALPASKLAKSIALRFERIVNLPATEVAQYKKELQGNIDQYDALCLHAEILLGIESTAVASHERLKKQVEVLQSALKNADNQAQIPELLAQLMRLPVSQNEVRKQRLLNLVDHLNSTQFIA